MKAFVIMPFKKEFDDVFLIGIKETAKKYGVNAYRLDEELFDEGMLDKIYKEIESSDFLIADLSEKNPNVFYELGFAHANGKLCVLITQSSDNIPFDLKHRRHIIYGNSIKHLQEQLSKNIEWAIEEIEKEKKNPFEIEFKSSGDLEVTDEFAKANLTFIFDIENKNDRTSQEIQAIYLNSVKEWQIFQNGKKVPSKKSIHKPYSYTYQLTVETPKIPKKGWAQIEVKASKNMAFSWAGDEIKDSYKIQGNVLLEIATDKATFSKTLPLSLTIDNLPF